LDQGEITEDIYELDLPEDWRAQVEEVLLEDADSEALFSDSLDVLEDDADRLGFEHWFKPYNAWDRIPPYACS
ncbi:MAG TPA: hypothetical protein VFO13_08515, partial [Arthrobacter sp.]|nr:hypothetical protein [Arthrobacter sp.]